MRILHYILGLPPYRTGGSIKYCVDLMQEQAAHGDEVMCLWPGRIRSLSAQPIIKEVRGFRGIRNFEMINPLPVSLDEGIADICAYTRDADIGVFKAFLTENRPDILHVHTLMGLYAELVRAAKELGIKTVFTTHDYFGLCPKVTFFYKGHSCDMSEGCEGCEECNQSALPLTKIKLLQSPFYRRFKDSALIKAMRKRHRSSFFSEADGAVAQGAEPSGKYIGLRKFYVGILNEMDIIHCNSSVTAEVYAKFVNPDRLFVQPISHSNVSHNCILREYSENIRLIYLAPIKQFKGFMILRDALDRLWDEGEKRFSLHVYCDEVIDRPYIVRHGRFAYEELPKVFDGGDVLVAPSVCHESFGFTVLEALSYGVPVLASDRVGAKDLVKGFGEVFCADSVSALYDTIKGLTPDKLSEYNRAILENFEVRTSYELARCVYEQFAK